MTAHDDAIDPMVMIRRVLERERFCKDVGDGALSEMILSVADPIIRADERERIRKERTDEYDRAQNGWGNFDEVDR